MGRSHHLISTTSFCLFLFLAALRKIGNCKSRQMYWYPGAVHSDYHPSLLRIVAFQIRADPNGRKQQNCIPQYSRITGAGKYRSLHHG